MNKSVTIHFTTGQQIPLPAKAFINETSQHLSNKSVERAQVNILLQALAAVLELDIWWHDELQHGELPNFK